MEEKKDKKFDRYKELLYKVSERELNVSKEMILSKCKKREYADTRRIIAKILKDSFPKATVAQIGNAVARDHSNISTQLKEHYRLYKNSKEYTGRFDSINDEFRLVLNSNKPLIDLYNEKALLEGRLKIINDNIEKLEEQELCLS